MKEGKIRKFDDKEQRTHRRFNNWVHSNPLWILSGYSRELANITILENVNVQDILHFNKILMGGLSLMIHELFWVKYIDILVQGSTFNVIT